MNLRNLAGDWIYERRYENFDNEDFFEEGECTFCEQASKDAVMCVAACEVCKLRLWLDEPMCKEHPLPCMRALLRITGKKPSALESSAVAVEIIRYIARTSLKKLVGELGDWY